MAAKTRDGVALGQLGERAAHVALDGGQEQALGAVLGGQHQLLGPGRARVELEDGQHRGAPVAVGHVERHAQDLERLAAVEGQDLVRAQLVDAQVELVVELEDLALVLGAVDLAGRDGARSAGPFRARCGGRRGGR